MALTSTNIVNPVKTSLVSQTASTSASGVGDDNIAGGPVYLISLILNNTAFASSVFTALFDATNAVKATDTAVCVLRGPPSGARTYSFFPPLYFANGLTVVTSASAGQAGTAAPGTPPAVTLLLSSTSS